MRAVLGSRAAPLAAALIAVLFAAWVYGWRVIDPSSAAWLLHGDPAQHYLGSVFFLSEPWHWPPGLITRFGEAPTSVVFTDALPLAALLSKLLGVPAGLQYFGLWMVLCHAMSAWWGVRLLHRMGLVNPLSLVAGALMLATAPVLLSRAYGHEALMGQFLLLMALDRALAPWRWAPWLGLVAAAVLVHPYLALMVCVLGSAAALAAVAERKLSLPALLVQGSVSALVLGAEAWLAGYFAGSGQLSAEGHRYFSANILTWFNPMAWREVMGPDPIVLEQTREWTRWLRPLKQTTWGQYEGFAYFGAGALLALALAAGAVAVRRAPAPVEPPARWTAVFLAALALALLSLSARPTLGGDVLADIPLGETGEELLGVFRASGRFIWPLTYLVMAWAIANVGRLRWGVALLVALLLVQEADLLYKLKEFRLRFREGPPPIEQAVSRPEWSEALSRCPNLELVSEAQSARKWAAPALAAGLAGARFYPAPTARYSPQAAAARQAAVKQLLTENGWRGDTVYLLIEPLPGGASIESIAADLPPTLRYVRADGYDLAVPVACLGR